jgi:hypothetical protein
MKTNVMMERKIFGNVIKQRSDNGFFSLTDMERAGNAYRIANGLSTIRLQTYFAKEETKDFIREIENRYTVAKIASRGRYANTWGHPLLFIDMALTFHPKLKLEVYEWIQDELIKYRNDSGDSYKNMCGAIMTRLSNKSNFRSYVKKVAVIIRLACKVKSWETATEEQLKKRDRIQDVMTLYTKALTNPNDCLRMAVIEVCRDVDYSCILDTAKEEFNQTKK